jgi:hypothetical protein
MIDDAKGTRNAVRSASPDRAGQRPPIRPKGLPGLEIQAILK